MIDFYSFAPEIFILALILISITFGILNKGATITINTSGFSLLTIFLIFKGHSLYQNSLYSLNPSSRASQIMLTDFDVDTYLFF